MRQGENGAMLGVFSLRDLACRLRRGRRHGVAQHVGERGLLAAEQQQREQQGQQGMENAAHGEAIRPQDAASIKLQQQALEVLALGKGQIDRMVAGALQALHDARGAPGIERGAGDDLLEQFGVDAARA